MNKIELKKLNNNIKKIKYEIMTCAKEGRVSDLHIAYNKYKKLKG